MDKNLILKNYGVEISSVGAQFICDAVFITLRDMTDETMDLQVKYLQDMGFTLDQIANSIERHDDSLRKNYVNFIKKYYI